MGNDLISIIIPAYNTGKYIKRCLDSVCFQTYKNLDIIVVNDGSNDDTDSIVRTYNNVRIFNKPNGGSSSARNFGLKYAKGNYVIFVDSDDYIERDFVSKLYEQTSGKKDEIIMCDFLINGKKENDWYDYLRLQGKDNIYNLYLYGGIYNRSVTKLYPINIFDSVSFPEGRDMLEDAYFTSHMLEKCNRIVRIPYAGYNYIRRDDSISRKKHNKFETAGKYSNVLEKDVILSKYISKSKYNYFSFVILEHITDCIKGCIDIKLYEIDKKIIYLSSFLYANKELIINKKAKKYADCLINVRKVKDIKRQFFKFTLFYDTFSNKYRYFKSMIRKIVKKY